MYILQLNDMRYHKIEMIEPVARATTKEELVEFMARERVESYMDETWRKVFRKDGPLEWYNGPGFFGGVVDAGTEQGFVDRAIEHYQRDVMSVATVPSEERHAGKIRRIEDVNYEQGN